MKQIFFTLVTLLAFALHSEASGSQATSIRWLTNYDQAVKQAQAEGKPLLLFFTGSDWCGWCKKLESEALDTPEFAALAGDKFVFVLLDFPRKEKSKDSEQNNQLKKRFNVSGFPVIIILDQNQQQIGTIGYRPGGGKEYAEQLLKMVKDYSGYKQKVSVLDNASSSELKALYEQSKTYQQTADAALILEKGMQSDDPSFFMMEKMRTLAADNQLETKEAVALRQQLRQLDPDNSRLTHYTLALIEFEARYAEFKQNKRSVQSTIAPLITYVERHGAQDKENGWRVNMVISQVLYSKSYYPEALKYARQSFSTAPARFKGEIAEMIGEIETQIE